MSPTQGDDAKAALLENIKQAASQTLDARELLQLAEAWAWLRAPGESHGGGSALSPD